MQNAVKILLEISVYSSIMIIIIFGIKSLFSRKVDSKIMSFLWIVVLIRLMLPVTLESPVHIEEVVNPFSYTTSNAAVLEETSIGENLENKSAENITPINMNITETKNTTSVIDNPEVTIYQIITNMASNPNIWAVALYLWIIGTILILVKRLYRIIVFRKKILISKTVNPILAAKLEHARKIINIKTDIRIAESKHVDIPLVYGLISPTILLPIGFAKSIGDKKLSLIILHELCHVKRKDLLANYFWLIAKTLHWFNPLVQIAYKSYLDNIEEACDKMVLCYLGDNDKFEYTQSLLDVIRLSKNKCSLPLSVSFCNRTSSIKKRVIKMIRPQKKSKAALLATLLITCVMIVACFTTACQPDEASIKDKPQPTESAISNSSALDTNITPEKTLVTTPSAEDENIREPEPIPEDPALIAIQKLNLSSITSLKHFHSEDYFGDKIISYTYHEGTPRFYEIMDSDYSLVSFEMGEVDLSMNMQLSDDELKSIAVDYANNVWGYGDAKLTSYEKKEYGMTASRISEYTFRAEGAMGESKRPFYVSLNGRGELISLRSYPQDVDLDKGVSWEEARQNALEYLKECAHITDSKKLTLKEETLEQKTTPLYAFSYEYRADNPTAEEFDYDCTIKISASSGEIGGMSITPDISNIDVMQPDEAEQMAKEYVAKMRYLSEEKADRITTERSYIGARHGKIEYSYIFFYSPKEESDTSIEARYTFSIYSDGEAGNILGGAID